MKKFSEYQGAGGGGDKSWLNLQQGDNKLRILSGYEEYGEHYDQQLQRSFVCLGEDECKYCAKMADLLSEGLSAESKEVSGLYPRVKYLFWAIDRSDGAIKVLKAGHQVVKAIKTLAQSDEYGFDEMPDYDMNIQREGSGLDTKYSVIPARKSTPLTEAEQKAIDEKLTDLTEIIDKMKAKVSASNDIITNQEDDGGDESMENIPF